MTSEKFENGLFIFRRDLRIVDNKGLNFLSELCKNIYTIFIFTPEQVGSGNKYKSDNAVQFMIESLQDVSSEIHKKGGKLYTFYGHNDKIVSECIKDFNINIVAFNLDITPYARERDAKIQVVCEKMGVLITYDNDYYLNPPTYIMNGSGNPYQKFTPYYEKALKRKVDAPQGIKTLHLTSKNVRMSNTISLEEALRKFTKLNSNILVHGGRTEAITMLKKSVRTQTHYAKTHNDLDKETSLMSSFIKFGCVSIREVYKAFHGKRDLIRQLYWRDFYAQILYHFPYVLGSAMKPKYNKIKWHHNEKWFKDWCEGKTGYPIVDAGMRQLNETGYMHNRSRLIVASFLIKTLMISWKQGEQYFSTKLTDYDPGSNNGNWQWTASTGADSQPFFRIFNPWMQSEEYDPDCVYIKKWVLELAEVPVKDIHNWYTEWINYKHVKYPKPICDYSEQKEKALKMYKDALY